ncbi:MAG TPA: MaoC/PaaZ C-terminal domain-containing protein [Caulobacteraceae bacterium]|nr:MaoC/PaaZ C-terminal domain-containing protein [Caulobacteraceae bacterium]
MAISLPDILALKSGPRAFSWDQASSIRYALGLGYGTDPTDERQLRFVYEKGLRAVPTMSTVIPWGIGPDRRRMGIDYSKLLHGEQQITIHEPLAAAGEVMAEAHVSAVYDKGVGKGAVIVTQTTLRDRGERLVATLTTTLFARADGGFGGDTSGAPQPHPIPDRAPDVVLELPTRPEQALLYRLNGDLNPLHADPGVARAAGFPQPILHGLCTYGMTCRGVMSAFTDDLPEPIGVHAARFAAPLFPGETLVLEMWRDGEVVSFRGRSKERDLVVVNNGRTELR